MRTSRKHIHIHLSRQCIGCKPFVSSENGRIQSKGSKTPEWSSVESVQSVQYNDEKWKPLIKLTFPWYFWHLTLFAAFVTFFPQMQSSGVRTAPETFATQHWVASQPYWNGDVKLPKNADLMSSCPVSSSNMSKYANCWISLFFCTLSYQTVRSTSPPPGPMRLLKDLFNDSWSNTDVRQGFFCHLQCGFSN